MPPKLKKTVATNSDACVFCYCSEDDEEAYGKLLRKSGITIHYFCMLFSNSLWQRGKRDCDGILGFLPADIKREQKRGLDMMCHYCKKKGATIGCTVADCGKIFHFRCGRKAGGLCQFYEEYRAYCPQHRPRQTIRSKDGLKSPESSSSVCSICILAVEAEVSDDTLYAPCCRNSWFHRICIQRYAVSAGFYFFKCPLCNNKELFEAEMLKHGIYIPKQDASWEREPRAYQELLERYNRCDADVCICPKGRAHKGFAGGQWDLLLCTWCGSGGTHVKCCGLTEIGKDFLCKECLEVCGSERKGGKRKKQKTEHGSPYVASSVKEIQQKLEYQRVTLLKTKQASGRRASSPPSLEKPSVSGLQCRSAVNSSESESNVPVASPSLLTDHKLVSSTPVVRIERADTELAVSVVDSDDEVEVCGAKSPGESGHAQLPSQPGASSSRPSRSLRNTTGSSEVGGETEKGQSDVILLSVEKQQDCSKDDSIASATSAMQTQLTLKPGRESHSESTNLVSSTTSTSASETGPIVTEPELSGTREVCVSSSQIEHRESSSSCEQDTGQVPAQHDSMVVSEVGSHQSVSVGRSDISEDTQAMQSSVPSAYAQFQVPKPRLPTHTLRAFTPVPHQVSPAHSVSPSLVPIQHAVSTGGALSTIHSNIRPSVPSQTCNAGMVPLTAQPTPVASSGTQQYYMLPANQTYHVGLFAVQPPDTCVPVVQGGLSASQTSQSANSSVNGPSQFFTAMPVVQWIPVSQCSSSHPLSTVPGGQPQHLQAVPVSMPYLAPVSATPQQQLPYIQTTQPYTVLCSQSQQSQSEQVTEQQAGCAAHTQVHHVSGHTYQPYQSQPSAQQMLVASSQTCPGGLSSVTNTSVLAPSNPSPATLPSVHCASAAKSWHTVMATKQSSSSSSSWHCAVSADRGLAADTAVTTVSTSGERSGGQRMPLPLAPIAQQAAGKQPLTPMILPTQPSCSSCPAGNVASTTKQTECQGVPAVTSVQGNPSIFVPPSQPNGMLQDNPSVRHLLAHRLLQNQQPSYSEVQSAAHDNEALQACTSPGTLGVRAASPAATGHTRPLILRHANIRQTRPAAYLPGYAEQNRPVAQQPVRFQQAPETSNQQVSIEQTGTALTHAANDKSGTESAPPRNVQHSVVAHTVNGLQTGMQSVVPSDHPQNVQPRMVSAVGQQARPTPPQVDLQGRYSNNNVAVVTPAHRQPRTEQSAVSGEHAGRSPAASVLSTNQRSRRAAQAESSPHAERAPAVDQQTRLRTHSGTLSAVPQSSDGDNSLAISRGKIWLGTESVPTQSNKTDVVLLSDSDESDDLEITGVSPAQTPSRNTGHSLTGKHHRSRDQHAGNESNSPVTSDAAQRANSVSRTCGNPVMSSASFSRPPCPVHGHHRIIQHPRPTIPAKRNPDGSLSIDLTEEPAGKKAHVEVTVSSDDDSDLEILS